jgi:hypothetical protein
MYRSFSARRTSSCVKARAAENECGRPADGPGCEAEADDDAGGSDEVPPSILGE